MPAPSSAKTFASVADIAACRAMLQDGSRTFFAASLVLPSSVRAPATSLYAFCRMADDAIDRGTDSAAALAGLRSRLDAIYRGEPHDVAADRAFADVVVRHSIPHSFPSALLEGFEWDATNRRYRNLADLSAYGVRVAGTVGAMMAMVMGVRSRALIARACELGVAMQLTNIARDVGEDANLGRLYLPLDWMRAAGLDPEAWLRKPVFNDSLKAVIKQLLGAADVLYARSDAGITKLPAACRPGMYAARFLYAEIGAELARRGHDSVHGRAIVSWQRKTRILAGAVAQAVADAGADRLYIAQRGANPVCDEMLDEALFLLDAVQEPVESGREHIRWPRVEDRVVWLMNLFERLERREHTT